MSVANRDKKSDCEPIELFATVDGIRAVDSPVRVKILAMLKEQEMPFDEIVAGAGKAKSTVSVHLNGMIEEAIVGARLDPLDRRKKIFFINASYLGGLARDQIIEDDVRKFFASNDSLDDPPQLFKLMFRTIRVELCLQGINIEPVLCDAGYKMGGALYGHIGSPSLDELLDNMARFWSNHRLGRVAIESYRPLTLLVYDCFECSDLPLLGRPACAFDLGMLKAIFQAHFEEERPVEETDCYAMGGNRCRFVIGGKA